MQEEIQKANLTEEREGIQKGGLIGVKGFRLGHSGPNSWNKAKPAYRMNGVVYAKLQIKGILH